MSQPTTYHYAVLERIAALSLPSNILTYDFHRYDALWSAIGVLNNGGTALSIRATALWNLYGSGELGIAETWRINRLVSPTGDVSAVMGVDPTTGWWLSAYPNPNGYSLPAGLNFIPTGYGSEDVGTNNSGIPSNATSCAWPLRVV